MRFITVRAGNGDLVEVNLEQITHMRRNAEDKTQTVVHFSGGQTLNIDEDSRTKILEEQNRPLGG